MTDADQSRCVATKANDDDCRQAAVVKVGPVWVCHSHASALESWAWHHVAIAQGEYRRQADQRRRVEDAQRRQRSIVYYVHGATSGLIKIGYTENFKSRLPSLRVEYREHGALTLLAWHQGDVKAERVMHRRFDDDRVEGEWFLPSDELLAHIEKLKQRHHGKRPTGLEHHGLWPAMKSAPRRRAASIPGQAKSGCSHGATTTTCSTCICVSRARAKAKASASTG